MFVSSAPWLPDAVAAAQVSAIIWLLFRNWPPRYRAILVGSILAIGAAVIIVPGLTVRSVGLAVTGSCHAVAYISLLIWFATSLRPGREPVVTAFARRVRTTMPDSVVRYTRQVTIAWCGFFAGQLAISATLFLLAPHAVWSTFVNLLNLPLLATMTLAEFGFRGFRFRHESRTSLIDTLSAMRFRPAKRP